MIRSCPARGSATETPPPRVPEAMGVPHRRHGRPFLPNTKLVWPGRWSPVKVRTGLSRLPSITRAARSTAASVCPARCNTPPGFARSGKMCPGWTKSAGTAVGSAMTRMVRARSAALIPVVMPSVAEDKLITAAAKADPDAQPLTPTQLQAMVPLKSLRGRPKSDSKKLLVSVRYSPEVVAYFKSTGEGWQSRMDGVLQQYVARHSRRP